MKNLKRVTLANPEDFSRSGMQHFNFIFSQEIKINPAAISSISRFRVGVTETKEVKVDKGFFNWSYKSYIEEKLVDWVTVFEISMINGDRFFSLDEIGELIEKETKSA